MKTRLLLSFLLLSVLASAQTYTYSTFASFKSGGPILPRGLIIDSSGNLYGPSGGGKYSNGTIFKVTPKGAISTLYSFNPNGDCGEGSPINLARDTNGNLYAGAYESDRVTTGALFTLTVGKNGGYTCTASLIGSSVLEVATALGNVYAVDCLDTGSLPGSCDGSLIGTGYTFTDPNFEPIGNLVINSAGDVFGLAADSVDGDESYYGYVYEVSPVSGFSTVHNFDGTDGSYPAALRQDAKGNLYGITSSGGAFNGGTVFKITAAGVFSTLYNFCSLANCADGGYPWNLTLDSKGNIFGLNSAGMFKLTPAGVESVIYSGDIPNWLGLAMDKSGNFYGAVLDGGTYELGSVDKLTKH